MAGTKDSVLTHAVVQAAAKKYRQDAGPGCASLGRAARHRGHSQTSRPQRLAENLDLLGFELSADEMKAISALDQHRRFNDPGPLRGCIQHVLSDLRVIEAPLAAWR